MSDFIFKYFSSISAKAWKQKIQYLLQGDSYQSLIKTNIDGVDVLPFYTLENRNLEFSENIAVPNSSTNTSYFCIATIASQANNEALEAQKCGVQSIYFAVFDPYLDWNILLQNIKIKIYLQCYFLENDFCKNKINHLLPQKNITVIFDILGKISKTGNWHFNFKKDSELLKKELQNTCSTLSINLSLFHNAGANNIQQIAYGLAQYQTYAESKIIDKSTIVIYQVSVSTDLYHETAKLKTLRLLHQQLASEYNLNLNCEIIQIKSKRNLSAIHSEINQITALTESHIAMLGGVNVLTTPPKNFTFYKEDALSVPCVCNNLIALGNNFNNYTNKAVFIEKIMEQQQTKVLDVLKTIQKGGGYVEQLKKGSIQRKIREQETLQTERLENKINQHIYTQEFTSNKTPIAYPFLKRNKRKTLWQPIIEKQWRTSIEFPIWESLFENEK